MPRYRGPSGANFTVTPSVAVTQEYIDKQVASGEWEEVDPAGGDSAPTGDPSLSWKKADLEAYATGLGIEVSSSATKEALLDLISSHEGESDDSSTIGETE